MCSDNISMASAHVINDFEVNQTKIKGGCQSGRKVVPHNSKSDLALMPMPSARRFFLPVKKNFAD